MEQKVLRQRMYHLTMYNISDIQKGIQSYHSGMEYVIKFALDMPITPEFNQWIRNDKVVIILNGGTSNNIGYDVWQNECAGTMEKHYADLIDAGINCTSFYEPDLNNSMSAIAFLLDERVWDKELYPDPVLQMYNSLEDWGTQEEKAMVILYGEKVAFLRKWLKQFRLA